MTIKIINPIDYPNWNKQVTDFEGATIFHTSNWARVLSESYGYRPTYFCTTKNGKLTNVIPVMEISSFITGKRGVSLPFSDQVKPLISNDQSFQEIFDKMILFGKKNNWKTLSFHSSYSFFKEASPCHRYISSYIELQKDPLKLFRTFKGSTKRNTKKAKKAGVKTKICNSRESIKEFYRLNCLSRRGHGIPPQPYFFFEKIYEDIIKKGMGFVCLGYYLKKAIAGVVFFILNESAIYKYGASEKAYLSLRPNNIVFWEAIKYALANGAQSVDLGRTETRDAGLLQYKRGWNAIETDLSYFKFDISTDRFLPNKYRLKSSYYFFNKLPIPILKSIGNILYKHIG